MNLKELLLAVRQEGLSQPLLEKYRDQLIYLRTDIHMERAELKRKRALFLLESKETSVAAKKLSFDGTPEGQRLFTLDGYATSIKAEIESLRDRIFSKIRLI